uniref:CDP-diacylglycerol--glycerol-3-phosphate 3-phosphatidyltransferase n=1 Tax=Plectus sambesii TaxID=2011161 RepID=A0A914VQ02_9BILA
MGDSETKWLDEHSPCIPVASSSVEILHTPEEFFLKLKELIKSSQKRIILSALYLGTGSLEQELVDCIRHALETTDATFRVRVLFDYTRGTRGIQQASSTTMLQSLVDEFADSDKIQVHLYHTPDLRGFLKKVLPERFNEVIGLQHMKLYIFDDSMIISGANLSDSYFTNRQDRYILIKDCPALTDFYAQVVHAVARSSFVLDKGGEIILHEHCREHPYNGDYDAFCSMLRLRISNVVERFREKLPKRTDADDTVIYPLVQMGPVGVDTEDCVLRRVFANEDSQADISLASGYFNLTDDYTKLILERGRYKLSTLSASPQANGFFGGHGISGYVPQLYSHVSLLFFKQAARNNRPVQMFEYDRPGWTFHAKGIWWDWHRRSANSATFVGSTNFGYRSVHRDLEAQLVIVTENEGLKQRLREERTRLFEYSSLVDANTFRRPDHRVSFWVRVMSRFIRNFF